MKPKPVEIFFMTFILEISTLSLLNLSIINFPKSSSPTVPIKQLLIPSFPIVSIKIAGAPLGYGPIYSLPIS